MKLARFTRDGKTAIGKIVGEQIVDLSAFTGGHASMRQFLTDLPSRRSAVETASEPAWPLSSVQLEAPIDDPQKFLAIGMNYQAHADEAARAGIPIPKTQLWFNKQVSCIAGPNEKVVLPSVSDQLDYEGELAYVIGTRCRKVKREDALSVVAGYLICNDFSVRDWQHRSPTFTLGKSFDTHGVIGPWITTADEVPDPRNLLLRLSVNGKEKQRSLTDDLIYKIEDQIVHLSTVMTLEPGDIITTGTPAGVAAVDQSWLKPGDIVRVEIDGLGSIENTIVGDA
jgi:2-keto-4-pentenoate hydratase/2-oxohepta-3-ene-1,7-dioic acid hydratase in catechol pathway